MQYVLKIIFRTIQWHYLLLVIALKERKIREKKSLKAKKSWKSDNYCKKRNQEKCEEVKLKRKQRRSRAITTNSDREISYIAIAIFEKRKI